MRRLILGLCMAVLAASATAQVLEQRFVMRQDHIFGTGSPVIRRDAVSVSGGFVKGGDIDMEEFLTYSKATVKQAFRIHLGNPVQLKPLHDILDNGLVDKFVILLDIEFALHPSRLYRYWDPTHPWYDPTLSKQSVADAYAMRLEAVKEVVSEDYGVAASVGLYGTLVAQATATPMAPTHLKIKAALIELGELGNV